MVTLMATTDSIIPISVGGDSPKLVCMMMPIGHLELSEVVLANHDEVAKFLTEKRYMDCLLYTSPSPRDS